MIMKYFVAGWLVLLTFDCSYAQGLCDGWYCIPTKINRTIPPWRPNMPDHVRRASGTIDSLARLPDSILNDRPKWAAALDSNQLFYLLGRFYDMNNYDPLLYQEYMLYGDRIDTTYKTGPGFLEHVLLHEATAKLHRSSLNLMLHASAILHVRILKTRRDPIAQTLLNIDAEILGGVKGLGFSQSLLAPLRSNGHAVLQFKIWNTFSRFSSTGMEPDGYAIYDGVPSYSTAHPTYGDLDLAPGSELYVFVEAMDIGHEGDTAWYEFHPLMNYEVNGGVYVIKNNTISDPQHYWSNKDTLTVSEFENVMRRTSDRLN